MKDSFTFNLFSKILILASILAIVPFIVLCLYAQPALDDFGYAMNLSKKTFLETQIHEYMNWGSRYTATCILITNPIQWDFWEGYKLISLCMILFFVIATFFMFYKLFLNIKITIILSCSFILSYLFMVPEVVSAFYWLAGSATYHFANILFIFFIGLIASFHKKESQITKIFLFLLTFLIIGCNEISMIYLDIFIFISFIYCFYDKKKINYYLLSLLIWAGILTLFILISPGNAKRSSAIMNHLSFFESFFMSIKKSVVIIFRYGLIIFFINLLVFYNIRKKLINIIFPILNFPFYYYIVLLFIFLFFGSFPSLLSIGNYPPQRTLNVVFLPVLISSIIFSYKIVFLPSIYNFNISSSILVILLLFIIFGYSFAIGKKELMSINNNLYHSYYDLFSGTAKKYDLQIKDRYKIIKSSRRDTIFLFPLNYRPKTILIYDLSSDPNFFYNHTMANFFKKKAIYTIDK